MLIFLDNRYHSLQKWGGAASFLNSREGVTQGDQIYMVPYGIGIILLIKLPKAGFPDVTHPWYADNSSALGTFANFKLYFNYIKLFFLGSGYYPKPSKSVLIMHLDNLNARKLFGLRHVFKVYTGAC